MINLKILFKNKTKYDKEIYRKFLEFHSKKYHFQSTLFNVIIIAFILFLIVLQITYKYYSIAILSAIIFTGFCLYRYFHPIFVVTKELKGETISQEKSFTFKFYERYFKVSDNINMNTVKYLKPAAMASSCASAMPLPMSSWRWASEPTVMISPPFSR